MLLPGPDFHWCKFRCFSFVEAAILRLNSLRIALHEIDLYGIINPLRNPDPEKERSERKLSIKDFLDTYNEGLPEQFTPASIFLLKKFREESPKLFQDGDFWTLDKHRMQFMDWVRRYMRSLQILELKSAASLK